MYIQHLAAKHAQLFLAIHAIIHGKLHNIYNIISLTCSGALES